MKARSGIGQTGRLLPFNRVEPRVDTLQSGAYVTCFVVEYAPR
jgi:hypothetical protein